MSGYSTNWEEYYADEIAKEYKASKCRKDLISNLPMEYKIDCLFAWSVSQRNDSEIIDLYNAFVEEGVILGGNDN